METSLHRKLKHHFAGDSDQVEVTVDGYRIDALDAHGRLVEIQHSALGAIRKKIANLLANGHSVRIIKPWIGCKWIETYDRQGGNLLRRRKSPKKLTAIDIFRELIHFTQVFPHPNMTLELLFVDCVEQRIDRPNRRWKRKQYEILDQHVVQLHTAEVLNDISDLWKIMGNPKLPAEFDTRELADCIAQPRWFAQQIAYTLHRCGATRSVGKRGNSIIYKKIAKRKRQNAA
ncbi:MAG: hypothetical protein ABL921_30940 [Pirellula sp.]